MRRRPRRRGGHERVALIADAQASLPDLPGSRDVIGMNVTRRDGVPFAVHVPYVRDGQAVRLLPGVMEVGAPRTGMDAPPAPEASAATAVATPRAAPIPPDAASIPPDGRDGMRE